jgi:hypothetical protein
MARLVTPALLALALLPLLFTPALAQSAGLADDTRLQQELRHRRAVVRPPVSADAVAADVAESRQAIAQRRADEAAMREVTRPPAVRPDTRYDVYSAIQAQRTQRR